MLKIRLMRIGGNQRPFYRVVVIDERSKRNGAYIELLGTYNPLTEPKDIKLKQDRIDHWIKMGAQMSDGFLRIIGKAPQRPPRKPKKEKKESSAVSPQPSDKEEKTEEKVTEEVATPETTPEQTPDQPVIPSEAKQSSSEDDNSKIATEPSAPRNDGKEKEQTDEGPA